LELGNLASSFLSYPWLLPTFLFLHPIVDDTSGWHRSFLPAIAHDGLTMYSDLSLVASCSTGTMCERRFSSLFSFLVLHQIEGGRKRAFAYVIYT